MDYISNSNKSREAKKPVEKTPNVPVAKGTVQKKTGIQKFTEVFIQEDLHTVRDYIWRDVLVPSIKSSIDTMLKGSIDILLYGEVKPRSSNTRTGSTGSMAYWKRYDEEPKKANKRVEINDIAYSSRSEAENVLATMDECIDKYEKVSIADFYEFSDVSVAGDHTLNNYGWTNLKDAKVMAISGGSFIIKLPKPELLT